MRLSWYFCWFWDVWNAFIRRTTLNAWVNAWNLTAILKYVIADFHSNLPSHTIGKVPTHRIVDLTFVTEKRHQKTSDDVQIKTFSVRLLDEPVPGLFSRYATMPSCQVQKKMWVTRKYAIVYTRVWCYCNFIRVRLAWWCCWRENGPSHHQYHYYYCQLRKPFRQEIERKSCCVEDNTPPVISNLGVIDQNCTLSKAKLFL